MKHFRQSYGNQATRHSAERCWKKGWLWAPLAFDAFEPFLSVFNVVTEPYSMTNGSRQVWNMNCARSPQPCWSPSSGPCSPGSMAQGAPGAPQLCSMHVSVLRKTLRHVTVLWYTGAWSTISTYSRWVAEWPMFVGDLSLKAECGSHTPWHALARPGTCKCRNLWFPRVSCRTWIGFGACSFLHVVSSCREVIPGGTKATIVGVDEDGDLPVFTDDGKTMVTWCSMWLQARERQCGPRIPTSPTLQQKSDVQTTSHLIIISCAKSSNVLLQNVADPLDTF